MHPRPHLHVNIETNTLPGTTRSWFTTAIGLLRQSPRIVLLESYRQGLRCSWQWAAAWRWPDTERVTHSLHFSSVPNTVSSSARLTDTLAPCGKLPGRTRSLAISSRHARKMERWSSGKSSSLSVPDGRKSKSIRGTQHLVGSFFIHVTPLIRRNGPPSQFGVMGSSRTQRHPRMRLFRRQDLRPRVFPPFYHLTFACSFLSFPLPPHTAKPTPSDDAVPLNVLFPGELNTPLST
jgi:hypothetical protein